MLHLLKTSFSYIILLCVDAVRNVANGSIGSSLISRVLLANADTLCAAASPLLEDYDVLVFYLISFY